VITVIGADFYTRGESPAPRQAMLLRQLQKLKPGASPLPFRRPPDLQAFTSTRYRSAHSGAAAVSGAAPFPPDDQRHPQSLVTVVALAIVSSRGIETSSREATAP